MKAFLAVLSLLTVTLSVASAQLQDVQISVNRQKLDEQKSRQRGTETVTTKEVGYKVTVQNRTFKTIPELQLKYMIFYEEPQPGSKEAREAFHKGSHVLALLEGNRSATFDTEPLKLTTTELDGNKFYLDGGPNKSKDRVLGVWIRAYAGDKLVGEYVNPSTLSKKNDWKE